MNTFMHWPNRALDRALALGVDGVWLGADEIGTEFSNDVLNVCYADPRFRFILFIWPTQSRLLNEGDDWTTSMTNAVRWLHQHDVARQCAGIQWGDEWWSALYTGSLNTSPYWRALHGMAHQQSWALRFHAAALIDARFREFRAIWRTITGHDCPPVGVAESGGCEPPEFPRQEWWSFNIYLGGSGFYLPTPESVQALYNAVWNATRLPVQPVVGMFGEQGKQVPSVAVLGHTYWPILMHRQVWSAGVFCFHHPSAYDNRHGTGVGILQMDPSYADGLRILCAEMKGRFHAFTTVRAALRRNAMRAGGTSTIAHSGATGNAPTLRLGCRERRLAAAALAASARRVRAEPPAGRLRASTATRW